MIKQGFASLEDAALEATVPEGAAPPLKRARTQRAAFGGA